MKTTHPALPGSWPTARIALVLGNLCANAMVRGRPTPVAEVVLARITNTLGSI